MEIFGADLWHIDFWGDAEKLLQHYGIWAVSLCIFLESFGAPVPAETLLVTTAALASQEKVALPPLLLASWVGAVVGDNVGYMIGRFGGRQLVLRFGRYVFITEAHLGKVEVFFVRYGSWVVLVARFFAVLRQLNGVVAGMGKMAWPRFMLFNMLGAALWVGFWGLGSFWLGEAFHLSFATIKKAGPVLLLGGLGFAATVIVLAYLHRRRHR